MWPCRWTVPWGTSRCRCVRAAVAGRRQRRYRSAAVAPSDRVGRLGRRAPRPPRATRPVRCCHCLTLPATGSSVYPRPAGVITPESAARPAQPVACTGRPRSRTRAGSRRTGRSARGSDAVDDEVGRRTGVQPRALEPSAGRPARGAERVDGGQPGPVQRHRSRRRSGRARCRRRRRCRRTPAPPPRRPAGRRPRRRRAAPACARRRSGTWRPRRRCRGKVSTLISVGTSAVPRAGHLGDQVVGQPGAVLDAVDAGADQARAARRCRTRAR